LADFGSRAVGLLVDMLGIFLLPALLVGVGVFALIALTASNAGNGGSDVSNASAAAIVFGFLAAFALVTVFPLIYRAELVYRRGQTVGHRVAKVMVVDGGTGGPLSRGQAWARAACQTFLSNAVFGLGYWWALWDPQRRTLHDLICNTCVIKVA
jgi:uncharacterized RDD family membrane protein YckC